MQSRSIGHTSLLRKKNMAIFRLNFSLHFCLFLVILLVGYGATSDDDPQNSSNEDVSNRARKLAGSGCHHGNSDTNGSDDLHRSSQALSSTEENSLRKTQALVSTESSQLPDGSQSSTSLRNTQGAEALVEPEKPPEVGSENVSEEFPSNGPQVGPLSQAILDKVSLANMPTSAVERSVYNNYKQLLLSIVHVMSSDDVAMFRDWVSHTFSINSLLDVSKIFLELDNQDVISALDLGKLRDFFVTILRIDVVHMIDCFMVGNYTPFSWVSHADIMRPNATFVSLDTKLPAPVPNQAQGEQAKKTKAQGSSRNMGPSPADFKAEVTSPKNQAVRGNPVKNSSVGNNAVSSNDASANGTAFSRKRHSVDMGSNGRKLSKCARPDSPRGQGPSVQTSDEVPRDFEDDLEDESQWLCRHYKRRCYVKFGCCDKYWPCHRCHNNDSTCGQKKLKSRDTKMIKCAKCGTEQEFTSESQFCRNCHIKFAKYFCAICKHLDGRDNSPRHCSKCGICRTHSDNSFHCDVCGICLNVQLRGKHKCRAGSAHEDCCICLEDAFTDCHILPCSHKVHEKCATEIIRRRITRCPVCRESLAPKLVRRRPPPAKTAKKMNEDLKIKVKNLEGEKDAIIREMKSREVVKPMPVNTMLTADGADVLPSSPQASSSTEKNSPVKTTSGRTQASSVSTESPLLPAGSQSSTKLSDTQGAEALVEPEEPLEVGSEFFRKELASNGAQVSQASQAIQDKVSLGNMPTSAVERSLYNNYKLLFLLIVGALLADDVAMFKDWVSHTFSIDPSLDVSKIFWELDCRGVISTFDLGKLRDSFATILRIDIVHMIDCFMVGNYTPLFRASHARVMRANNQSGARGSFHVVGSESSQNVTFASLNRKVQAPVPNQAQGEQAKQTCLVPQYNAQGSSRKVGASPTDFKAEETNPDNQAVRGNLVKNSPVGNNAVSSNYASASGTAFSRERHPFDMGSNGRKLSKFARPDAPRGQGPSVQTSDEVPRVFEDDLDGESQWLCSYYKRRCHVKFGCCDKYWPCHRCHNNDSTCGQKKLKSRDTKMVKCAKCGTEQEFTSESQFCRNCHIKFAKYFCATCKHLTGTDDHPYHCSKCGICRIHSDHSFHCDECGVCLDVQLRGKHKCRAGSAHEKCCICSELPTTVET